MTATMVDPATDVLARLEEELAPACQQENCEDGHPAAEWIMRTHFGCGHDITWLICDNCHRRLLATILLVISVGGAACCHICEATRPMTVVEDVFTFEPLHP